MEIYNFCLISRITFLSIPCLNIYFTLLLCPETRKHEGLCLSNNRRVYIILFGILGILINSVLRILDEQFMTTVEIYQNNTSSKFRMKYSFVEILLEIFIPFFSNLEIKVNKIIFNFLKESELLSNSDDILTDYDDFKFFQDAGN